MNQPRPIRERLEELYSRLRAAPRPLSPNETLKQLCDTLDEVEDLYSGVKKKSPPPSPLMSDGRMYGPLADFTVLQGDGSILAQTRGHRIEIGADSSLRIINKITGKTEFEK